jgi:para-aminobenzoate synthetase component 1
VRVGRYLWAVVIDHQLQRSCLMHHPKVNETSLQQVQQRLAQNLTADSVRQAHPFVLTTAFVSNMDRATYGQALNRIDDYIHAGDCYQINFTQRFSATCSGDPWLAYRALRKTAPTPFAAFLESNDGTILSLSPERFLEASREGKVETRPIKGTRPRATNTDEDQYLAQQLLQSPKDRAENLMIVDLLRNDLSKSCLPGSVNVPELFSIEHYPNVHHMVSSVCGILRPGVTAVQLLRDCFPGGSITGAPKIRAMEIIDELEPQRRSIYCGSIGYISACGTMDTSITIRTLLVQKDRIYCWAGGGIVADSDIDDEYQESYNKVNNLLQTLEQL